MFFTVSAWIKFGAELTAVLMLAERSRLEKSFFFSFYLFIYFIHVHVCCCLLLLRLRPDTSPFNTLMVHDFLVV